VNSDHSLLVKAIFARKDRRSKSKKLEKLHAALKGIHRGKRKSKTKVSNSLHGSRRANGGSHEPPRIAKINIGVKATKQQRKGS